MKVIFNFILILFLLGTTSFVAHKYYVSITKIEIDETEGLIKIQTELFADDFEKVMNARYEISSLSFSNLNEREKEKISNYITKKMILKVNNSVLGLDYLGSELKGELLYVYLEGKYDQEVKRVDVENALLQGMFLKQQNKVDINYKNKVKSLHLHAEAPKGVVFF